MTLRATEQIAAVLREILPGQGVITAVTPMMTGFSNDTYLVEGPDLILRMPPAAGAMLDGHDVIGQARIYAALGETPGAPIVPEIVHIEQDPALLGAPFFLMRKVPGEAVSDITLQPWFTEVAGDVRRQMCCDWVSAFARLAHLQPLELLGAPISPVDDLRMWQRFADDAQCPALVAMIDRLAAITAPVSGPPAVIQGDSKLSNLMWDNYRISAMLEIEWHEIAQIAKITAIIAEGTNMFDTGRSTDPKLAYFKQNLDHYLGVVAAMLDGEGY